MTPAAPRILSAAASHQGLVRGNNEDRVYCDDARGFFVVIDGMGGHAAGEQAAEIALERIRARLERQTDSVERRVREAIALANNAIYEAAQRQPDWHGMACVLTLAVIVNGQATVGHVGDSRLYKIRRGHIEKITSDHSPVGEREDRGEISEREAMQHPRRNEVYRDVGSEEHTPDEEDFIEIRNIGFEQDSALLLCTDGLSDVVSSQEILRIVEAHASGPQAAVDALIEAANRNSKDNVSAILIEREAFASPVVAVDAHTSKRRPVRDIVLLLCGALIGLAALAIHLWQHEPAQRAPQVIQVGAGRAPSISAALNQAQSGDTIEVAPGEYREQIQLKEGVTVIAVKPRETIIKPPNGEAIVAESVRRTRLMGVKVEAVAVGILVRNSEVNLERVEVTGARVAGVQFSGASEGILQASYIHHNEGAGVVVEHPAKPALEHNVIVENGKGAQLRPGLEILSLAHPVVLGNTITQNGAEPIWQAGPADPTLIENNFFGGDQKAPARKKVRLLPPGVPQ